MHTFFFPKQINIAVIRGDPLTEKVYVTLFTLHTRLRDTVAHQGYNSSSVHGTDEKPKLLLGLSSAAQAVGQTPPVPHALIECSSLLTGSSVSTAEESKIN